MVILEYLLLFAPLLTELITDYRRIEIKHKNDTHVTDVVVRTILCICVGIVCYALLGKESIFQGFLYSLTLFALFDPLLNLLRGKPFFYKGVASVTDRLLVYLPAPVEVFVRVWVISVGIGIYYYWELL
jgi:hypothetical protein